MPVFTYSMHVIDPLYVPKHQNNLVLCSPTYSRETYIYIYTYTFQFFVAVWQKILFNWFVISMRPNQANTVQKMNNIYRTMNLIRTYNVSSEICE